MTQVNRPNSYYLKGKDKSIVYTTTSFTGQPKFIYEHRGTTLTFEGNDIHQLDTEIGQQVMVTLNLVNDDHTTTLTLLVPEIHLDLAGSETSFITTAIITTHQTSIGGPNLVQGVLQTYRIEKYSGTAQKRHF
jgi:hypothetical protein